jgi:hypothetical protein
MLHLRLGVPLFVLAALLGGWMLGSNGQDGPGGGEKDSPKLKGMLPAGWKKLGLRDEQIQSVYRVQAAYRAKIEFHQQKIAELKAEEKVELEKILTKEQLDHLKEIRAAEKKDAPKDKDEKDKDKKDKDEKDKDKKDKDAPKDK